MLDTYSTYVCVFTNTIVLTGLFVSGRGMTVNESAEVSVITLVKERNSAAVPITVTLEVPDINPDDPGFGARGT